MHEIGDMTPTFRRSGGIGLSDQLSGGEDF
jgi:hypothetical protein